MRYYTNKKYFFAFTIVLTIESFIGGLWNGKENQCLYQSFASRINVGYIVGCELARPRFNLNK